MTVNVTVEGLEQFDKLAEAFTPEGMRPALSAAASAFRDITKANMGDTGLDRPKDWKALRPRYAKRVKRSYATLVVDGTLKESVKADEPEGYSVDIGSDVVYAAAHQHGNPAGNLPDRPYFPVDENGELTEFASQMIEEAIMREMDNVIGA